MGVCEHHVSRSRPAIRAGIEVRVERSPGADWLRCCVAVRVVPLEEHDLAGWSCHGCGALGDSDALRWRWRNDSQNIEGRDLIGRVVERSRVVVRRAVKLLS